MTAPLYECHVCGHVWSATLAADAERDTATGGVECPACACMTGFEVVAGGESD